MRAFLALAANEWREARDRRATIVLGLLVVAVLSFFLSLTVERIPVDEAIRRHAVSLGRLHVEGEIGSFTSTMDLEVDLDGPRPPLPDDDLPLGIEGLRVLDLRIRDRSELDQAIVGWRAMKRNFGRRTWDDAPPPAIHESDHVDYLREKFEAAGYEPVLVSPLRDAPGTFRIGLGVDDPGRLLGAARVHFLSGVKTFELTDQSERGFLAQLQSGFVNGFAGFVGMLILLGTVGSLLPEMMQKGRIELVLSRPVSRSFVLLARYATGVLFVLAFWAATLALAAAVMWPKTGRYPFELIGCSLTIALVFAVLHAASVLFGVATRNANLATLGGLGLWGLSAAAAHARSEFVDIPAGWQRFIDRTWWVLPKPGEIEKLNERMLGTASSPSGRTMDAAGAAGDSISFATAAGTSVAFASALLALALLAFRRRDW